MDLWNKLKMVTTPIALYGMGNGAQLVLEQLQKIGKRPVGIFASDEFVRTKEFCGYSIKRYDDLVKEYPDMIILVCFGTGRAEVLERIDALAQKHQVYCPDVPVYGSTIFTYTYASEHRSKLEKAYNMLGDELSQKTFEAVCRFKLSGEYTALRQCECDRGTFSHLPLSSNETYLDLGAYRGDTITEFLNAVNDHVKIYAVEPNPKTFMKLADQTEKIKNVELLQAAVSDRNEMISMHFAGRGTALKQQGTPVKSVTVDTLLGGRFVSLIKMDVEGQEAAVLQGARETILKFKPKLIVSAYHRSEDIFEIPLFLNEIRNDYTVLLRHFPHNLAWDTNFYFI